ncbi:unnamed protein product, partial [Brassica rapa]
ACGSGTLRFCSSLTSQRRDAKRKTLKPYLIFEAEAGEKSYTLYLMCDSYLGCDHEYSFSVDVKESGTGDHMEE